MNDTADQNGNGAAFNNDSSRSSKLRIPALVVRDKKQITKVGMMISLGSLVLTGLTHFKGHKSLHTWSGIALLGFSFWHHRLNTNQRSPARPRV